MLGMEPGASGELGKHSTHLSYISSPKSQSQSTLLVACTCAFSGVYRQPLPLSLLESGFLAGVCMSMLLDFCAVLERMLHEKGVTQTPSI